MKDKSRNLLVGLTVLIALVILGGLIVQFQELPSFLRIGYQIKLLFPEATGVTVGSDVFLAGTRIGRIAEISFTDNDPRQGVTLIAVINPGVRVPGNANAIIRPRGLMGGQLMEFRSNGLPPGNERQDPRTGRPLDWLPEDGSVAVRGSLLEGGLLPPDMMADVRDAMKSLKNLAQRLDEFLAPPSQPALAAGQTTRPVTNLHVTLGKLDDSLDAVTKILGDPQNQANIKVTLANLQKATGDAVEVMAASKELIAKASGTFDSVGGAAGELSKKLITQTDKLGEVLTELNHMVVRLNRGEGTAGKLFNDPELYNNMVDITVQLKGAIGELQELLELWKKQGMKIKL